MNGRGARARALLGLLNRYGWQVLTVGIAAVIAWSAIRGVVRGYEPIADNALLELRSRDVLTGEHPLLGTWSSASIGAGIDVNNTGPLLFDLMAIPIKVLGEGPGIALSLAAFHIVTVWLVGHTVARATGPSTALVTQVVTAGLVWTLGSELLYDPWQPNVLVLPFWLVICCAWVIADGHVAFLPLAVGYGSFAMQTHLSYLPIVPVLLVFAVARVAIRNGDHPGGRFSALKRPLAWSGGLAAVLWAQPLWEQFSGEGRGNLTRLVIASTGGEGDPPETVTTGVTLGVRILGAVLALPPWWGSQGYSDSIPSSAFENTPDGPTVVLGGGGLPSTGVALLGLLVLAAIIGVAFRSAYRNRLGNAVAGLQTFVVAAAVGAVIVIIAPIDILGLSPHRVRWLWVVAAFGTLMLALTLVDVAERRQRPFGVIALGGLAAVGVLAVAATVPYHAQNSGPVGLTSTSGAVSDIRDQLDDYLSANPPDAQKVLFDADGIGFGEPYTSPVMAALAENDVDFVVDDSSLARQVGEGRRDDGDPMRSLMYVRVGGEALDQPGAERIAFHPGDEQPFSKDAVRDVAVGVFLRPPIEDVEG